MSKRLITLLALAAVFASCQTREQETPGDGKAAPELIASVEDPASTRSMIQVDQNGEGTIYWMPADRINVFYGTASALYVSQNTENAATAVFRSSDIIGSNEGASAGIWGLYPYDEDATCNGKSVTTSLPSEQYGVPDTFDDDLFITLSYSTSNALQFYNVCGGIKFSLSRSDITSISFRGNANEDLAGRASLRFDNGIPKATVLSGLKKITLTPKVGDTFAQGVNYYLIMFPVTLSEGFTMTFRTADGSIGTFNYTENPVTIKRSVFSKKALIDTYATFGEAPEPHNVIYYTSTDGEVVTPHSGDGFGAGIVSNEYSEGQGKITFDGDVTEIGDGAFSGSSGLESIEIPEGVTSIGDDAFKDCENLSSITIPDSVTDIGEGAFDGCDNLQTVKIESTDPPSWDPNVFDDAEDCTIYVPKDSVDNYKNDPGWGQLADRIFPIPDVPIPILVDLGLPSGLKWASFNLGASKPEDYGDYYAWGETEPYYSSLDPLVWKPEKQYGYNWMHYKWAMGSETTLTKYCSDAAYGYNGFTDGKITLDPEDDAAQVNLGDKWRMPTDQEWNELTSNCSFVWTQLNGVGGFTVTSKKPGFTDKFIFLPAAGVWFWESLNFAGSEGYYWSLTGYRDSQTCSYGFWFHSSSPGCCSHDRCYGFSVRPVYGKSAIVPVASVYLDKNQQELVVGETAALVATVLPENATNKSVTWSSSNTSVATVSSRGVVTGVGAGTAIITVTTIDGGKTVTCTVTVTEPYTVATPKAVDLGLSVKWASFNLGASKPEEYGDYYAWGETESYYSSQDPLAWKDGKEAGYAWPSYKWCMGSNNTLTKYCNRSPYGYNGFTDTKTALDPEDDAANVNLGGSWRMPTDAEWAELMENCTWTWTTQNGVNGRLVTASNGNSIFLPAAGGRSDTDLYDVGSLGYYWSSSLDTGYPDGAWLVVFGSGDVGGYYSNRVDGYSVRPVSE